MMSGYRNRDQESSEILWFDKEGRAFIRSGDLGRIDEQGFVYLLGRKRDMIISGGFNIFAIDLQNELLKHDAVLEAAVIGVPSETWGETALAFVVVDKATTETPGEHSHLGQFPARQEPEDIHGGVQRRVAQNQIGKILKNELRKPYWDK